MIIKKFLLSLCLLSMVVSSGHAVFIGITSLSKKETGLGNQENNPQVILVSDAHMTILDPMLKGFISQGLIDESTQKAFSAGSDEQCAIVPRLVSYLLNDKKSKKCLITETIGAAFCDMARLGKAEACWGITSEVKDPEVLFCVPRLLLRQLQSAHESLEMKSQVRDAVKAKASYDYLTHYNILLREQFKWIAGDNRKQEEMLIGLFIQTAWPMLKELMEKKDPHILADDAFQKLTIGFLKEDMVNWSTTFKEKGIDDQSIHNALVIINSLLEQKELQETDHIVALYDYVSEKKLMSELKAISDGSVSCCTKKFDAELQYYLQQHVMYVSPEHKPEVTCIIAGAMHADYVQTYLTEQGFQTDYVVGVSNFKQSDFETPAFLQQLPGKIELVNKAAQLLLNTELDTF